MSTNAGTFKGMAALFLRATYDEPLYAKDYASSEVTVFQDYKHTTECISASREAWHAHRWRQGMRMSCLKVSHV